MSCAGCAELASHGRSILASNIALQMKVAALESALDNAVGQLQALKRSYRCACRETSNVELSFVGGRYHSVLGCTRSYTESLEREGEPRDWLRCAKCGAPDPVALAVSP